MTTLPRVSVIVPVFNEPSNVLRESLESLKAQTYTDFECHVIDESTDLDCALQCRDFCANDRRFHYVHPEQRVGLPASLNLALQKARGEFVARFDSDDICSPDRLALQIRFMDTHPDISVLGGALEIIREKGSPGILRPYPQSHTEIARGMQSTNSMAHPTVMFRRTAFENHGCYDPSFRFSEDLELWLRWLNAGLRFANLPDTLVMYRQHATSRPKLHWRYNLRARIRNFAPQYVVRRVFGIAAIGAWMILPSAVQEAVFRALLLKGKSAEKELSA